MIRDAKILIAALPGRFRHCFERIHAIRQVGMRVQDSTEVLVSDQLRQGMRAGSYNLVLSLPELGFDEWQPECRINFLFGFARYSLASATQAALVQHHSVRGRQSLKLFVVASRSGCMEKGRAEVRRVRQMDLQQAPRGYRGLLAYVRGLHDQSEVGNQLTAPSEVARRHDTF